MATARIIGRILILFCALMSIAFGVVWIGQYVDGAVSHEPGVVPETMLLVSGILAAALGLTTFALMIIRGDREMAEQGRDEYRSSRDVLVNAYFSQDAVDAGLQRLALNIQAFVEQEYRKRKEFMVDPSSPHAPDVQNELFLGEARKYHDDTRGAVKAFTDAMNEARAVRPDLRYYISWTMYLPQQEAPESPAMEIGENEVSPGVVEKIPDIPESETEGA